MRNAASLAVALVLALGSAADAQAPAGTEAEHDAHHPAEVQTAQPTAPPATTPPDASGPAGTMRGDMGRMMQMMTQMPGGMGPGQGMVGQGAGPDRMDFTMRPFRRIEGQLAYIRTELRITDAQAPQWNAFADAVRAQSGRLRQAVMQGMQAAAQPVPAPQQIEQRIALVSAHLEAMRTVQAAMGQLYTTLSEDQRRTADELMAEHLRAMRMGMP